MTFDRATVKTIREQMEEVLGGLAHDLKAKITVGSASFTANNIHFKVEVAQVGENGEANTQEAQSFKLCARMYGLTPDDLGKTFKHWSGQVFTITGASSRRCRTPIFAERSDGKRYRFPAAEVVALLKK